MQTLELESGQRIRLRLIKDEVGDVTLEAYNDDGVSSLIVSLRTDGTLLLYDKIDEELGLVLDVDGFVEEVDEDWDEDDDEDEEWELVLELDEEDDD